jgi:hypothetical protein
MSPIKQSPVRPISHNTRSARGASLGLVAAFSGVLILCLLACYGLATLFGASEEARNGVDASALNLANKSILVKTPPQSIYGDVADTTGAIGLTNINRVWGKALIVNANVQSMEREGQAGPSAQGNAESAFTGAQSINDALFDNLTNNTVTGALFNNMAERRNAKMLAGSTTIVAATKLAWPTAALNRGGPSNITMAPNQIPPDAQIALNPVGNYAPGYVPIQANNREFYFVALPIGEKPHLVSSSVFQLGRIDQVPVGGVKNPVPNSFSASGSVQNQQDGMVANAFAIANPQRQYQLSIPHAYLSIQVTNNAIWIVEGKKISETQYGLSPDTQWGVKMYQLKNKAILNGYASLGNEYQPNKAGQPPTLWQVLTSLPGNYQVILQQMTQRLQEISPNVTQAQLEALLAKQPIVPTATRYLIYPTFANADQTGAALNIAPVPNPNGSFPAWLSAVYVPDGTTKALATEGPQRDAPNFDWQTVVGGGNAGGHYADLIANLDWEPDSGYNQCLGQLTIAHTTECYFAVGQ